MLVVRDFAYQMLQKAKDEFQRTGRLMAVGYLIRADGATESYELDGENKEDFRKALSAFKRLARNQLTVATITICGGTFRAFPPWEKDKPRAATEKKLPWLEEAIEKGGGSCVSMDIDVPGQSTINVMVPYSITESGDIKFEEPEEGLVDFEGPQPNSGDETDWPD